MTAHSREFIEWLRRELGPLGQPYLRMLIAEIASQQQSIAQAALRRGDTEYEKGQQTALKWAVELAQNIAKETVEEPEADSTKIGAERERV